MMVMVMITAFIYDYHYHNGPGSKETFFPSPFIVCRMS